MDGAFFFYFYMAFIVVNVALLFSSFFETSLMSRRPPPWEPAPVAYREAFEEEAGSSLLAEWDLEPIT